MASSNDSIENAQPYMGDRLIVKRDGYSVVFSKSEDSVPFFCPVCTVALRTHDDEHAYEKLGCCSFCAKTWAYTHYEAWSDGWRPSQEQLASVERPPIVFTFEVE